MTEEIDENCPKCNQHNVDLDKLYTDVYDVEGFILGGKVDCVNSYLCMDCGSSYHIKYSAKITSLEKELGESK